MNFKTAAQNSLVLSALEAIEDKLRERGLLNKATGDSETDVTLEYGTYVENGEEGPYLLIKLTAAAPAKKLKEANFEMISDFVNEKIEDLKSGWNPELIEGVDEAWGQVVLLNGSKVY